MYIDKINEDAQAFNYTIYTTNGHKDCGHESLLRFKEALHENQYTFIPISVKDLPKYIIQQLELTPVEVAQYRVANDE